MKAIANSLYDAIEKLCDAAKDLVSCLDGNVPLSSKTCIRHHNAIIVFSSEGSHPTKITHGNRCHEKTQLKEQWAFALLHPSNKKTS
jgi:hypothetical protein